MDLNFIMLIAHESPIQVIDNCDLKLTFFSLYLHVESTPNEWEFGNILMFTIQLNLYM